MYRVRPDSPRDQHRAKQAQRVNDSPTLAVKFPKLKSLSAAFNFSDSTRPSLNSDIKYFMELDSKSIFRVGCRNNECVGGDFDLSAELAEAISKRRKLVEGEMSCRGWRDKDSINKHHCTSILKYRLTLAY